LFQTFFAIKNRRARVIIDGGSCNNLVSLDLVKKLGLTTRPRPHPYHILWFNDSGKVKVTQMVRVHFSIGIYSGFVDCHVVPMEACSLCWVDLGKKITLLPLTPAEIVQAEKDRAESAKNEPTVKPENQQAIKLKAPVMLAMKYDLAEIHVDDACCYALVCKDALFSMMLLLAFCLHL